MYLMMRAIGEMLYMDPDQHTLFINFITKYLGKGWVIFQDTLGILGMAEITAVSNVQLWFKLASLADSNYLFSAFSCVKT